jgi:alpha-galactosidase
VLPRHGGGHLFRQHGEEVTMTQRNRPGTRQIGRDAIIPHIAAIAFAMAVMISSTLAAETKAMHDWAGAAFLGPTMPEAPTPAGLDVRRQDYGEFRLRRSVLDTPLKIGTKAYEHGLGTHSNSEIVVRLGRPAKSFRAEIGIDTNYDTAGQRGSVVFTVEAGGKERFRSELCRGGEAPRSVSVPLDGASELILRVLDGGDGPGWDQSDWADAAVVYEDGQQTRLDEMPVVVPPAAMSTQPPFSFTYGGKSSREFLSQWKRELPKQPKVPGRPLDMIIHVDPATGLQVSCEVTRWEDFPAVEWVLRFSNSGKADTPILENIRPLDLQINAPPKGDVTLHHSHGSTCSPTDFLPLATTVGPKADLQFAPNGGRSSDGHLPFFNLEWAGGGLVGAIGWTGQWTMRLQRNDGRELALQAGQQFGRFTLHPGESVRTPRILLVGWRGDDRMRGHNLLRRLLLAHYAPRHSGELVVPPITQNTWFAFNQGNDVTESNQLEVMAGMAPLGIEGFWLDAGWFEGGWPAGAGSWVPKKEAFPRGLKPLGDAAHKAGMKFVVWFEPERVNPASQIAREHPEWVLHAGDGDGLFNLGEPAARDWLTDYLCTRVKDWGIDIYRNDFNIDPLRFWQKADAPDRQGIAEIRYIEGLYAMWDAIRERCPGTAIDNCASGGRRIDLETCSRSYPLWRSDTQCTPKALPTQDQVQTAGLSLWIPLHACGVWSFEPYLWRSAVTTGTSICPDTRKPGCSAEKAKQAIREAKELRPLQLGDYYPLLDINLDERQWCGWQFDRPELGKGFAMFFRRAQSPYAAVAAGMKGLDRAQPYRVTFPDTNESRVMTGEELTRLRVEIDSPGKSALVVYEKAK